MGLLASGGRAEAEISHRMTIMQCRQLSPPTSLSDALPFPGRQTEPSWTCGKVSKDNSVSNTLSIPLLQLGATPTIATSQGELLDHKIKVRLVSSTFLSFCTHPTSTGNSN